MNKFEFGGALGARICSHLLAGIALLWTVAASAEGEMFPAQFGTGEQSMVNLLQCPDAATEEDENYAVFCQIQVNADGSTRNGRTYCFANAETPSGYAHAAADAARDSTFQPAIYNGTPVDVMFNFRVLFMHRGDSCQVAAVPNPGFQSEAFGMAYYSPQEVVSDSSWIARSAVGRQGGTRSDVIERKGMMFLLAVDVDEAGDVRGGELVRNNFGSKQEANRALRAAREAVYIPGFAGGEATRMKYFGFIYFNSETQPQPQNVQQRQSFIG